MQDTKTFPVYISHNEFGYANPSAIGKSSNEVVFNIAKVSQDLKSKIYGKIGIVQLTYDDMVEILHSSTTIRRVGHKMMVNIGLKK